MSEPFQENRGELVEVSKLYCRILGQMSLLFYEINESQFTVKNC